MVIIMNYKYHIIMTIAIFYLDIKGKKQYWSIFLDNMKPLIKLITWNITVIKYFTAFLTIITLNMWFNFINRNKVLLVMGCWSFWLLKYSNVAYLPLTSELPNNMPVTVLEGFLGFFMKTLFVNFFYGKTSIYLVQNILFEKFHFFAKW